MSAVGIAAITAACSSAPEESAGSDEAMNVADFTRSYWQSCRAVLGDMPAITPDDGAIVPVTGPDGHGIFEPLAPGATQSRSCEAPNELVAQDERNHGCVPYQRAVRKTTKNKKGETVHWVWLGRLFNGLLGNHKGVYNSFGLIAHNEATGETCYAEPGTNTQIKGIDGNMQNAVDITKLPPVTEDSQRVNEAWFPGRNDCVRCHQASPWVRNSWTDQVKLRDGAPFIPEPARGQKFKHVLVRPADVRQYLASSNVANPPRDAGRLGVRGAKLVSKEAATCTGCHEIGAREYCGSLVPAAFGIKPGDENPFGWAGTKEQYAASYELSIENYFASFPPEKRDKMFERGWHNKTVRVNPSDARSVQRVGNALKFIQSCCYDALHPQASLPEECKWMDVSTGKMLDWQTAAYPSAKSNGGGEAAPSGGQPTKVGDVTIRWYGNGVNGTSAFDAGRSNVVLFVHGWQDATVPKQEIDFHFTNLTGGAQDRDYAESLVAQGYNVGVVEWYPLATAAHVSEAEHEIWKNKELGIELAEAYKKALAPIVEHAKAKGKAVDVRVAGHSIGAQVVARLVSALDATQTDAAYLPDRLTMLDAYFSKLGSCANSGGPVAEALCSVSGKKLDFWPGEKTRDAIFAYRSKHAQVSVEAYQIQNSANTAFGDRNDPFFHGVAYEVLRPDSQHWQVNGANLLGAAWDVNGRRHAYPVYWWFRTMAERMQFTPGISAASTKAQLEQATGKGFYFEQKNASSTDQNIGNDLFEVRSWQL